MLSLNADHQLTRSPQRANGLLECPAAGAGDGGEGRAAGGAQSPYIWLTGSWGNERVSGDQHSGIGTRSAPCRGAGHRQHKFTDEWAIFVDPCC